MGVMRINQFDWTAQRVEIMIAGYNDGSTMSRIAMNLGGGVSRNAVIGKLHRMGFHRGRPVPQERKPRRSRLQAGGDNVTIGKVNRATSTKRKLIAKVLAGEEDICIEGSGAMDIAPQESPDAVPLLEATDRQCRWPLNDPGPGFLFCGRRTVSENCSWCPGHARMAFSPSRESRPYFPARRERL